MTRHTLKQFLQSAVITVAGALALTGAVPALASESSATFAKADNDVSNVASLQRGARNFVNYCLGCHSAKYVRYNQLARDLGMSEEQVIANLMFGAAKPTETMGIAMRSADAQRWFGQAPPDLSLIARSKGVDYIYNFLRSFYIDPSRPNGVNNLALPNASMPHVLWELQGLQTAIFEEEEHNGLTHTAFRKFEFARAGTLKPDQYDDFVRDTVNFLDYIAEPMKLKRQNLGLLVITFLLVFGLFAYLLKLEIWKDVK
ncbi:MAG: cytochrome c1 [Chromatiales bacterium]|jgi:ubiquinol-cytochrome c reductase cytochrome c1 subunit|nr:MAG: cytochrome c1 [Chromatiales bacterium]